MLEKWFGIDEILLICFIVIAYSSCSGDYGQEKRHNQQYKAYVTP